MATRSEAALRGGAEELEQVLPGAHGANPEEHAVEDSAVVLGSLLVSKTSVEGCVHDAVALEAGLGRVR